MFNIVIKTRYKIFNISPKKIKYCTHHSKYTDYTQFNSNKLHPHAILNRGVFKEDHLGFIKINNSNWDYKPGVLFSKLPEYKALVNHYTGKENWKNSKFASKYLDFLRIFKVKGDRGISSYKEFLSEREKQIDKLFKSIIKKGIKPINISKNKELFVDNISVNLTKKNEIYFNNRGHHRLAIAKILGLKEIPVKITVANSIENLDKLYLKKNN
tara:strand:+ start:130 stop:768 length:639 start_codon:yes stop_codon:yes gene_type:complete